MSFNSLMRAYMDNNRAASDPLRVSWLRRLANSATVGLSFGLLSLGCGGDADEVTSNEESLDSADGKADKASKKKKCYLNQDCLAGQYCKKSTGVVPTPKYGINPTDPTYPTVKYGILVPQGTCKAVSECTTDSDCATDQKCVGATTGSSCPEGAYCILPPTPAQKGICTIECDTDADCAQGDVCEGATTGSSCPEGAYCILPPTPAQKGLCTLNWTPTPTPKYGINPTT